jgi:hypothetical protein
MLFVMRFDSPHLGNVWVLIGSVGFAILYFATGCGRPGYMAETQAMCGRLNAVHAKVNLTQWVAKEIESHMAAATNRPFSLIITNVPRWVEKVDPGNRAYRIDY